MITKSAAAKILRRTLSSLAAIAAISTIFGVKALEAAQHNAAAQPPAAEADQETETGDRF